MVNGQGDAPMVEELHQPVHVLQAGTSGRGDHGLPDGRNALQQGNVVDVRRGDLQNLAADLTGERHGRLVKTRGHQDEALVLDEPGQFAEVLCGQNPGHGSLDVTNVLPGLELRVDEGRNVAELEFERGPDAVGPCHRPVLTNNLLASLQVPLMV